MPFENSYGGCPATTTPTGARTTDNSCFRGSTSSFLPDENATGLQFGKVVQVFTIVLVPVALGMLVRAWAPAIARRLNRAVQVLSVVVLLVVIAAVLYGQRNNRSDYFLVVGAAALTFNVVRLLVGYGVPRLLKVDHRSAIAAGFEIGIHNTALAITVALSPALMDSAWRRRWAQSRPAARPTDPMARQHRH